jgi:hypothetical protein
LFVLIRIITFGKRKVLTNSIQSLKKKHFLIFLFCLSDSFSNIGCTDPLSKTSISATVNDGSCTYRSAKVKVNIRYSCTVLTHETSGLVFTTICCGRLTIRTPRFTVSIRAGIIQKKWPLKEWSTKTGRRFHRQTIFLYWRFWQ